MNWQEIIITVIGTVVTALASWAVAKLTELINSKVKNEKTQELYNAALSIVSGVTKATYQTYVESLKGTDAWTKEAQVNALKAALESAKKQLSEEAQKYIERTHGNVDEWLATQIEAEIYDLKSNAGGAAQ